MRYRCTTGRGVNDVAYYGNYMNYYQPMQNQYQPGNPPMTNQTQQTNFVCRPVASKEEALGVPVDFMGSPMFFPDLAHNVIYVKRFNTNTGAADVFEFHGAQEQVVPPSFAPLDEFNVMKDAIVRLQNEVEQLKKPAGRAKKSDTDE